MEREPSKTTSETKIENGYINATPYSSQVMIIQQETLIRKTREGKCLGKEHVISQSAVFLVLR